MVRNRAFLFASVSIVVLLALTLAGCFKIVRDDTGQNGQATSGTKPIITQFSANPNSINQGESTAINWTVENAETVTIEPGIGNVALSGSTSVSPSTTTQYTIIAENAEGSNTATTQVAVSSAVASEPPSASSPSAEPSPIPPTLDIGTPPFIEYFAANPESITTGGSSVLSWNVTNTSSVTISPGIGTVGSAGTISVSPTTTTTYTITATNSYDSRIQSVTVSVSNFQLVTPLIPMIQLKPDLQPEFISRQSLNNYTAHIKNNGAVASEACKAKLYSASAFKFITCPAIAAGGTATIEFTFGQDPSCNLGSSSFKITINVDDANSVDEFDEGNNKYTRVFTCS